jgi:phthalate 4,5-dioxygenase oxygenase subunit
MLSPEDNERLTRVGPATPMGTLMRRYWIPAMLASELTPGAPPLRVMLLGERLIGFRDEGGSVGLVGEACPHRGASLFFGRCTGGGLRCAYHGWIFDTAGQCVALPTEAAGSPLRGKVRAVAYPCIERGGVVWAYLGEGAPPPLPLLDANLDEQGGRADATFVENNWLQSLEGDVDLPHLPHLHSGHTGSFQAVLGEAQSSEGAGAPRGFPPSSRGQMSTFEVEDTRAGFAFAGAGPAQSGRRAWNVGHFMFPFFANLPYGPLGSHWVVARVPMDDHHTMTYGMWNRHATIAPRELMFGDEPSYLPNTSDWFGRFRLTRNLGNDFLVDRALAVRGPSGISGQAVEDMAITSSMGPVVDRSREHLGPSDLAIIHLRRRLLATLRDGTAPAITTPEAYRVKHGMLRVAGDDAWFAELRRRDGAGDATPGA